MESVSKLESSLLTPDLRYRNLLISAVYSLDYPLIKKYLEEGADINSDWIFDPHTIFTKIVERKNFGLIEFLLREGGANVNQTKRGKITPLIAAIKSKSLEIVQLLIRYGADINARDYLGRTPLNEAFNTNSTDIVEFLVGLGIDINQPDGSGQLPIILAVNSKNLEVVKMLVLRGADIHQVNSQLHTAFTVAHRLNYVDIIQFFERTSYSPKRRIKHDIHIRSEYGLLDDVEEATETLKISFDESGNDSQQLSELESAINDLDDGWLNGQDKTLQTAISEDNLEEVERLLADGVDINNVDNDGFTPLTKAVHLGRIKMVEFLLTRKANSCQTINGKTPLIFAVQQNNTEIIQLLLDHGAEHTIQTALFEAVNLENVEIVKLFIKKNAILNVVYKKSGDTLLTRAIKRNNLQVVKILGENGVDVNKPNNNGSLPLELALENDCRNICIYLSQKGSQISKESTNIYLKKYLVKDDLEIVKIFTDVLKVDLDIIFDCGFSPLTKAADLGNFDVVKTFLHSNCNIVDDIDGNRRTALGIAAKRQYLPLVKYLINFGADVTLAKKEIKEFENCSEDFHMYMELSK